jgi:hypothetical protein
VAGLRIESESEARRYLRRVEAEGGEVGAWAREHGIDGRSLNAWRMNLARRAGAAEPPRRPRRAGSARTGLVELVPATPSLATSGRYVLAVGGVRIEVGDDFSEGTLRRLVGVLRSC